MKWRMEYVESAHFYVNKDIDRLIQETEAAFTHYIEGGDRQKAMKRLCVPPLGEQQSPWTTFKVGLFSGAFVVLCRTILLYTLMAAFLFNPTRTFYSEARYWSIRILSRILLAPLFFVNFADFWLADQLNSLVPAFLDIPFVVCFFSHNPSWHKMKADLCN